LKWLVAGLLFTAGAAVRVSNAVFYPTAWGFDAKFNWEYVELLRESWVLRAPETAWATSHPPLYYYLAAAVDRVAGYPDKVVAVGLIRGLGVLAGLGIVALAVRWVQRVDPGNSRRALLAAALLLFLPAHIYMSAMLNEEIVAAAFTSLALFLTAGAVLDPADPRGELWRAAAIGAAAGLAWLTKLSGVLVLVTAGLTLAWLGWRSGQVAPTLRRLAVLGVAALATGGWYYANNWIQHGYLYPFAMPAHELMFEMPPGERGLLDYVYVPLSTWTSHQLTDPDLLRSVWGSTYATIWYDGHRFFLPRSGLGQHVWGTRLLVLAVLPTLALFAGAWRALRSRAEAEIPLLVLTALTLGGYVLFTWRNPWFASVKGTYLLGLSIPFAVWASDALDRWSRGPTARGVAVFVCLGVLMLGVFFVFSYGLILRKAEVPGLPWLPAGAA
jgi:4-amino-4-deoxy-L-arabinose transferase-like glycosyltransferase